MATLLTDNWSTCLWFLSPTVHSVLLWIKTPAKYWSALLYLKIQTKQKNALLWLSVGYFYRAKQTLPPALNEAGVISFMYSVCLEERWVVLSNVELCNCVPIRVGSDESDCSLLCIVTLQDLFSLSVCVESILAPLPNFFSAIPLFRSCKKNSRTLCILYPWPLHLPGTYVVVLFFI